MSWRKMRLTGYGRIDSFWLSVSEAIKPGGNLCVLRFEVFMESFSFCWYVRRLEHRMQAHPNALELRTLA
jgi:hypothetical protein